MQTAGDYSYKVVLPQGVHSPVTKRDIEQLIAPLNMYLENFDQCQEKAMQGPAMRRAGKVMFKLSHQPKVSESLAECPRPMGGPLLQRPEWEGAEQVPQRPSYKVKAPA